MNKTYIINKPKIIALSILTALLVCTLTLSLMLTVAPMSASADASYTRSQISAIETPLAQFELLTQHPDSAAAHQSGSNWRYYTNSAFQHAVLFDSSTSTWTTNLSTSVASPTLVNSDHLNIGVTRSRQYTDADPDEDWYELIDYVIVVTPCVNNQPDLASAFVVQGDANGVIIRLSNHLAFTTTFQIMPVQIEYELERGDAHNLAYHTVQQPMYVRLTAQNPAAPTKTGYTFTGWYTDAACTHPFTGAITGNVTVYAGWRANSYTIAFHGNGSTGGNMSNMAMTYDAAQNLTANGFTKTGYRFQGWATSASGNVEYTNGQSVSNLTAEDGATINLYAKWTQVDYTVIFNANGGTGSMSNQTHTRDVAKALTTNAFTRAGYTFKGWATSQNGAVVYTNGQSVTNIGAAGSTVQLYAVWQANTYTVTFDANGGTGSIATQTFTYGQSAALTANTTITRTGYIFKGWSTSPTGDVMYQDAESVSNLIATANGNVTLYAVWEIIQCRVTFMVDGEVYTIVTVNYGTSVEELLGNEVNPLLYSVDGELPN